MSSTAARKQRRKMAKLSRNATNEEPMVGEWLPGKPIGIDFAYHASSEEEYVEQPGDRYIETEENKRKIAENRWETNLDEVVAEIKRMSNEDNYDWSWARNMDCKYVELRIDMRDGAFTIRNKDGKRISLQELQWQYRSKDEQRKND